MSSKLYLNAEYHGLLSSLLLLAVALVLYHARHHSNSEAELVRQTSSGLVHGIIDYKTPDVRQFHSIPYARPPIGSLRWRPPQSLPREAYLNHIGGSKFPPSCPQYLSANGNSIYTLDNLGFNLQGLNSTGEIDEDCLYVSIWTPTKIKNGRLLPVLIFIHGGAFSSGGINVPYQIPANWVQRSQGHIVVSFNYRLNIFGFPNAPGLKDQNLGLLDQRLAVEWIKQNIKVFGGDPTRMTLWGQSAGAMSVDFYNYAWSEDPIVKGLIMNSGTALLPLLSHDTAQTNFTFVADHFGCENEDSDLQLTCMQKIPFQSIKTFLQQHNDKGIRPSLKFLPIPDGRIVFQNYASRAVKGKLSRLPAIIGTTSNDGSAFFPYPVSNPDGGVDKIAMYKNGLTIFQCPAVQTTQFRHANNQDVFRYSYAGNFSNISPREWLGAYHDSELPLIFGTHQLIGGSSGGLEVETSNAMQDAYLAYASGGSQALKATGWKEYVTGQDTVRQFGDGVPVKDISIKNYEHDCTS